MDRIEERAIMIYYDIETEKYYSQNIEDGVIERIELISELDFLPKIKQKLQEKVCLIRISYDEKTGQTSALLRENNGETIDERYFIEILDKNATNCLYRLEKILDKEKSEIQEKRRKKYGK